MANHLRKADVATRLDALKAEMLALIPENAEVTECESDIGEAPSPGLRHLNASVSLAYVKENPPA